MPVLPERTPRKNAFTLPTKALADAIAAEWNGKQAFSARLMPLTAIANAALDIMPTHRLQMEQAMLAYAETDLLCYRSETPELRKRQQEKWGPVVAWAVKNFGEIEITDGVMPVEQHEKTNEKLRGAIAAMDDFALSAFSVLTQNLGSLLLALAVQAQHISGQDAFKSSRVDEDFQGEQWGEDSVSIARAREIERDVLAAERFLTLVNQ